MKPSTTQAIETFFSGYPLKRYKKGHILILAGDTTEYAFCLVEGKMKVYDVTYRGDEIIINSFQPPSFFPMSLIVNSASSRYIYEADTDIVIRQAPKLATVSFLDAYPDVVLDLLSRLYLVLDNVLERMVHTIASSAKSRLMYSLISECKRFGVLQTDGSYIVTISAKELGAKAGLSRETVSRESKILKLRSLIDIHHKTIVIYDLKKLERYSETYT